MHFIIRKIYLLADHKIFLSCVQRMNREIVIVRLTSNLASHAVGLQSLRQRLCLARNGVDSPSPAS
jgi:hypothetical protein